MKNIFLEIKVTKETMCCFKLKFYSDSRVTPSIKFTGTHFR